MFKTTTPDKLYLATTPSTSRRSHQPHALSTNTECSFPIWLDPAWQAEPDDSTLGEAD